MARYIGLNILAGMKIS